MIADFEFTNKDEEDWNKFNIKNEAHPQETSFNTFTKSAFDKMPQDDGASFKNVSIDTEETAEKVASPKEYQKKGIEIINMPQFSTIKSDPLANQNRPGGNIYFDHSGESVLHEVELSVNDNNDAKKAENVTKPTQENYVEEKFLTLKAEEIKIIGVVFKTYIITEYDDSIYVIDQHAMHERQNYDKLKKQINEHNVAKQDMLIPYKIKLLAKDRANLEEKLDNLRSIGFEITQNDNEFSVSSIPFVLSGIRLEKFFEEILADENMRERTASDIINEKLCQTACKHSIRAGDDVTREQIAYLIDKLKDGVALCPHGRPIIVKITRKELEKMFKRVL